MNLLRQTLLGAYQAATAKGRRLAIERRREKGLAPVSVLFYHRIADDHPNGWTLSTQAFERQLNWLSDRFDFVSLEEAQRRLAGKSSHRPSVAITFDDGYADNCEFAIPLLLRREIPFTYFVSTDILRDQGAFAHDLEAGVRLQPNTVAQIRSMADAGVEIGAHTRTHADMGQSTGAPFIEAELLGSKQDIEAWIGRPVRYFAFPFGLPKNLTTEACAAAREAGIEGICSAYGAYNLPDAVSTAHGPFHLRRLHADPEWARFVNWMTFDPRKLTASDPLNDPVNDDTFLMPPLTSSEPAAELHLVGENR